MSSILTVIKVFLFLLILLFSACNSGSKSSILVNETKEKEATILLNVEKKPPSLDSLKLAINFKAQGDYSTIISQVNTDRVYFKNLYAVNTNRAIDSASQYLYSKLVNGIVPHWYGTKWDFNGHTNIPNDGEIACGYFVSTTLKHLGFNLNRYKMAQQAGLIAAKMLQPKSELKMYSNVSFKSLKEKLNAIYANGIYFVGLDNHVGYILIKDSELYFLHSSYYDDKVMIELAEQSPCFDSNFYVFAEISTNKKLIASWILNERLNVPSN